MRANSLAFWSAARLKSGRGESTALQLLAPLWVEPRLSFARMYGGSKSGATTDDTVAAHLPPCSRAALQNASGFVCRIPLQATNRARPPTDKPSLACVLECGAAKEWPRGSECAAIASAALGR